MVNCCVPWCNNYYENTASEGVSYHQIPRDKKIGRIWKERFRRANLPKAGAVCNKQFKAEDYESSYSLREQLTGQKVKRRLKKDAVPSIFDFPTSVPNKRPRTVSERRAHKRANKEVSKKCRVEIPGFFR